jgi:molybdopterin molybdotransferase
MLSVKDAETIIFNLVQPLDHQRDVEIVDISTAGNRILANPITSSLDFPHWDNSAMDGFAVRYQDVQHSSSEKPVILDIVTEIPAGYQPQSPILPGQAARIFTGAPMPPGADTVVMQEKTQQKGNQVLILAAPRPQEFVRHQGSFYQAGTQLLPGGIPIFAPEIAVLAAAQCPQVIVFRRPRVAIFSTGNELVAPNQPLQPGQIVDSNQYALAALVRESGAEPLLLGSIRDEPTAIKEAITNALTNADLVISSGGVSVGEYDYVKPTLESLGAKIPIQFVDMRPGRPLTVATFPELNSSILYFGLPGNPVSVLVSFWRFVQPTIKKLAGLSTAWEPKFLKVRSHCELRSDGKRETYIWGNLHLTAGVYEFHKAVGTQSSGNLINLASTNALALLPVGKTLITPQEEVEVLQVR